MKIVTKFAALLLIGAGLTAIGCARPGEFGDGVAYSANERGQIIARNWDYEGKQAIDDLDHALLLRPGSELTIWHTKSPY